METYCDMLRVIAEGAEKPTRIMYKANLSWSILQEHFKSLDALGLLIKSSENGKNEYHLSDKGFQVLNQLSSIMEGLNLHSES